MGMARGLMKFGSTSLGTLFASANLTTRFAVNSFICIGIMTAALWFIVSTYLINQIVEREWQATAQIVRADVRKFLEEYDFKAQDRKSVGHKFVALLEHMRMSPDIVRFKVYNSKGVVIWSDDKRLVGKSFADNPELNQALHGQVVADMSSLDKLENIFEPKSLSQAIEVYVPIYSEGGGELLGVFETYRRPDPIFQAVRRARVVVLLGAVGGGLLLYASLFAIVRRAARQINDQQMNLLKMQSELVASQRMAAVGEMAAAVAHGIGNPLSSIRAAAQVAMLDSADHDGSDKNGRMRENLQNIVQQVDRMQKRMQGLLNFARPLEPRPGPVEINALVRDVVETLRGRFGDAQISTKLDLEANLPTVTSDVNHLEQALMGLLTNAVEATPKGGIVTVRTKSSHHNGDRKTVQVLIEDTGSGIPVENRDRIFEPFFTTKPHGTGIGLPLAKKFLERNGATLMISNSAGTGTKIAITLPTAA
jgi:two-component system, NtrC family, sensor histidine kinase HydH